MELPIPDHKAAGQVLAEALACSVPAPMQRLPLTPLLRSPDLTLLSGN